MNFYPESFEVDSLSGDKITCAFFPQKSPTHRLMILFPGISYNCDMPLHYYATAAALIRGYEILHIRYEYRKYRETFDLEQWKKLLIHDCNNAIKKVLSDRNYPEILLVGKSLGTTAIGFLLQNKQPTHFTAKSLTAIWLTPNWTTPVIFDAMKSFEGRSLHVMGSADGDPQWIDRRATELRENPRTEVYVVPNGDHSIEIKGDLPASIVAMQRYVEVLERFLDEK